MACESLEALGIIDIMSVYAPTHGIAGSTVQVSFDFCRSDWGISYFRIMDVDTGAVLANVIEDIMRPICPEFLTLYMYFTMPNKNLNLRLEASNNADFSTIDDTATFTILLGGEVIMTVTELRITPNPANVGEEIRALGFVRNDGNATGNRDMIFTVNGEEIKRQATGTLAPGENTTVVAYFTVSAIGTYEVCCVVAG